MTASSAIQDLTEISKVTSFKLISVNFYHDVDFKFPVHPETFLNINAEGNHNKTLNELNTIYNQ
jgi:hypothetical protein